MGSWKALSVRGVARRVSLVERLVCYHYVEGRGKPFEVGYPVEAVVPSPGSTLEASGELLVVGAQVDCINYMAGPEGKTQALVFFTASQIIPLRSHGCEQW